MENKSFRSVAFGGFDKQDVIHYIEQSAREAAEIQERLQQEVDGLRSRVQVLEERASEGERRAREAENRCHGLEQRLQEEQSARQSAEQERDSLQGLAEEVLRLRPEAEAYAQFRERVGEIECEAHQRAAALEHTTKLRLRQAVDTFQAQYRAAMGTLEATSAHVNAELRKMEVTLSQLPRAMDRTGVDLKKLEQLLERSDEKK